VSVTLKSLFNFDNADLAANRKLKLSEKQAERIRLIERSSNQLLMIVGCGAVGGAGTALREAMTTHEPSFWALAVIMTLLAIVLLQGVFFKVDNSIQLAQGAVRVTQPNPLPLPIKRKNNCNLWVGEHAFGVSPQVTTVVQEGETYTIYYTKGTRIILSIERVTG
jgi:hypothetical protein